MRVESLVSALAVAVLLAACGSAGKHYDKTPQQVANALRMATLPTGVLGSTVKRSRVTQPTSDTVVTALLDANGSELMRFVTKVEPDGTGSLVSTRVAPPEGSNKDRAEAAMAKNGFAMGMMGGLASEHVAAAIEGRPFDMMFASGPVAKGMAGAVPGMSEQINAANQMQADFAKAEQDEDFRKEYGNEWGESGKDESDGWGSN